MVLYLRHLWITKHGHTIEKESSAKIRREINTPFADANFIVEANSASMDYIALSDPSHPRWIGYKSSKREYLNTIIRHLKVEQIKPLLFAITMRFSPEEANKAFRFAVSMSVRFLIYGGRGGFLDEHYASRAHEIGAGKITKAKELRESLLPIIPTDKQFEEAFASARVSKAYLARYFLRALDKTLRDVPDPEFVANEDYDATNLKHIIALRPVADLGVSSEELASVQQMIGNMTLISSKKNVELRNSEFSHKVKAYKESAYLITNQPEKFGSTFGIDQVKERQAELAKTAVKTWSLKFD